MPIYALGDDRPLIAGDAFVANEAVVVGAVEVRAGASVWFYCLLRGDSGRIVVGENANIQDLAVLHGPTDVGSGCTVGHGAILNGCRIGAGSVIGAGAIVLDDAVLGDGVVVAAGAVVPASSTWPPGAYLRGIPARLIEGREPREGSAQLVARSATHYAGLARRYRIELNESGNPPAPTR